MILVEQLEEMLKQLPRKSFVKIAIVKTIDSDFIDDDGKVVSTHASCMNYVVDETNGEVENPMNCVVLSNARHDDGNWLPVEAPTFSKVTLISEGESSIISNAITVGE